MSDSIDRAVLEHINPPTEGGYSKWAWIDELSELWPDVAKLIGNGWSLLRADSKTMRGYASEKLTLRQAMSLDPTRAEKCVQGYTQKLGGGTVTPSQAIVLRIRRDFGYVSPLPNRGTILKRLSNLLKDRGLSGEFESFTADKKLRDGQPIISAQAAIDALVDLTNGVVLRRDARKFYGTELHLTHIVGEACLKDKSEEVKYRDLRHGDVLLATPDANNAMSWFGSKNFGRAFVKREPLGLVFVHTGCSSEFSVPSGTILVPFRPFRVTCADGTTTSLCGLLEASARIQMQLIKYEKELLTEAQEEDTKEDETK